MFKVSPSVGFPGDQPAIKRVECRYDRYKCFVVGLLIGPEDCGLTSLAMCCGDIWAIHRGGDLKKHGIYMLLGNISTENFRDDTLTGPLGNTARPRQTSFNIDYLKAVIKIKL